MRRLTFLFALLFLLTAAPAAGAKNATVAGTVVLGSARTPVAGTKVTLVGARTDGSGLFFEETETSDRRGRFTFDEVPVKRDAEYALEANYDRGLFVFDTFTLKSGVTEEEELRVYETTADPSVITIAHDQVFLVQNEQGASVFESVTVVNGSERAYIGRGRSLGDESSQTTLGFALPDDAIGGRVDLIDSTINRLYAEPAEFGFAATVAIPPGETDVTFAYPPTGSAGSYDLSRRALYPIDDFSVFATEPFAITGERLSPQGVEEIGGVRYQKWTSGDGFDAGDLVPILAVAEGSTSSNLWLGLGIGLGVVVLAAIVATTLRSKRPRVARRSKAPSKPERDELIAAIAELDLEHEAGALNDEQWNERRTRLKEQLVAAKPREPAK